MDFDKPYDFDDADIILRTPLSKGFRVHRAVLSISSPTLRSSVADIPFPDDDEKGGILPELDVEDAPEDLDLFLRLIYPIIPPPKFEDFETLLRAFKILQKYKVEGVQGLLKPFLVSPPFLTSDPVRVYAMACRFGFKEVAEVAAPLAVTVDFTAKIRAEDLREIGGVDYHRLAVLSKDRLKKSKNDISSFPIPCASCPQAFYDDFRKKLVEKLGTDEEEKLYDSVECLNICFTISKGCGGSHCSGVGGDLHFEKFVFALVKELQKPPAQCICK